MFDLIVEKGEVVDGGGTNKKFRADVGVSGGKIEAIGDLAKAEAKERLDAAGCVVTPGFIDAHSHSDIHVLINPNAECKLHQGITSEVVGNCGWSAFPMKGAFRDREQEDWKPYDYEVKWSGVKEYLRLFDNAAPSINLTSFVGQSNIRGAVMGFSPDPPSRDQQRAMEREVEEAMEAGAIGLSTGLIYTPGFFANTEEIVGLAKVVKKHGGMYASHIRSEGDQLEEAVDEALSVGRAAGIPVQVSHLKAAGKRNWGKIERVIATVERSNREGMNVAFDRYPYNASSTGLSSQLPKWVHEGGVDAALERLKDPKTCARIVEETEAHLEAEHGWKSILIAYAASEEFSDCDGLSVEEIGKRQKITASEAFVRMLIASRLTASICAFTMCQSETDRVLTHPLCSVCTDASAWAPYGPLSLGKPHPRAYGAFPKFLCDYVKERPLMSLEAGVAKMTSQTAKRFGLKGRGEIAKGNFADLVVMNWSDLREVSTYGDSHHYPEGIRHVVVNGKLSIRDGKNTGTRGGRFLRREK